MDGRVQRLALWTGMEAHQGGSPAQAPANRLPSGQDSLGSSAALQIRPAPLEVGLCALPGPPLPSVAVKAEAGCEAAFAYVPGRRCRCQAVGA